MTTTGDTKTAQVSYFENVDNVLDTYAFESESERDAFLESVLSEILHALRDDKTVLTHNVMSRVVERVIKECLSDAQRQKLFLALQGKFLYLAERPASSFVIETLVKSCSDAGCLRQVATEVILDDSHRLRLLWSRTGSHVIRALLRTLSAVPSDERALPLEAEDSDSPQAVLRMCSTVIVTHLSAHKKVAFTKTFPVAVVCVLIDLVPGLANQLLSEVLVDGLDGELMRHSIGSHLMESVIQHCPSKSTRHLFTSDSVAQLVVDRVGMRMVSSALKHYRPKARRRLWGYINPHGHAILEARSFAVLLAAFETNDAQIIVDTVNTITQYISTLKVEGESGASATYYSVAHAMFSSAAFTAATGGTRFGTILLSTVLTVLLHTLDEATGENSPESPRETLWSVCESVSKVPSDVLRQAALWPDGSKTLQLYVRCVVHKFGGALGAAPLLSRFCRRFHKSIVELCTDDYGSRLFEAMYEVADDETRTWMDNALSHPDAIRSLRGSEVGRILLTKYRWEHKRYRKGPGRQNE